MYNKPRPKENAYNKTPTNCLEHVTEFKYLIRSDS